MMFKLRLVTAGSVLLAGAAAWSFMSLRGASGTTIGQTQGQDPDLVSRAFGIHVVAGRTSNGMQAMLPNGQRGLTADEALQASLTDSPVAGLLAINGQLKSGVSVTAAYGLFTDKEYGPIGAGGTVHPMYQGRPAWTMTFSGDGVAFPTFGPHGGAHREVNVVVDAATGSYMLTYAYR